MIKRKLSNKILELSKKFPVIALIGPRQSGKTTLIKHLFPTKKYVSLEDIDKREFALTDPKGFLSNYPDGAILDEIQRCPNLFSYIQTIVDKKNKEGLFILTGSQNFLLIENITQTLAGRIAILKLLPFSLNELKNTKYEYFNIEKYIFSGFYPRIYDKNISPYDFYINYINTYVERDLRLIKNISNISVFQKFIKMCAGRTGQIVNLSSLGNDYGISHNTVKSWFSILETSYIIFFLKPYYKNFNKRLIKMPKLYFYDTGLACFLLGVEKSEQLKTHYLKGSLFENLIISEFIKNRVNIGKEPEVYYFRDKTGNEIDCIIELPLNIKAIEIKSGKTISSDYFKNLKYFNKISDNSPSNSYVVYGGSKNQKRTVSNVISWKNLFKIIS